MEFASHRAGFIHIVGRPNVGKSTLFNQLVQYPLSIATAKPQTTRDNIVGIAQTSHYQAIYVDTPGAMQPCYQLQSVMMKNVKNAFASSDIFLWVIDIRAPDFDVWLYEQLQKQTAPLFVLLNKTDLVPPEKLTDHIAAWQQRIGIGKIIPIHAQAKRQVKSLSQQIIPLLPLHPPYYDKDALTDRSERFLAAQIIRKSYLLHYQREIPYSVAIDITAFKDKPHVLVLDATIYVERLTQKKIIIGKQGRALKKVGTDARCALEGFFKKSVFLTQHVKVLPNWRKKKELLKTLGYH
ncbi:MAG: GTPase Era [Cytophagales bacterium]